MVPAQQKQAGTLERETLPLVWNPSSAGFFHVGPNLPLWHLVPSAKLSLPCRLAHSNLLSTHEDLALAENSVKETVTADMDFHFKKLKNLQLNCLENGDSGPWEQWKLFLSVSLKFGRLWIEVCSRQQVLKPNIYFWNTKTYLILIQKALYSPLTIMLRNMKFSSTSLMFKESGLLAA